MVSSTVRKKIRGAFCRTALITTTPIREIRERETNDARARVLLCLNTPRQRRQIKYWMKKFQLTWDQVLDICRSFAVLQGTEHQSIKKIDEVAFIQFVCKEWQRPHGNEQAFLELLHCAFTVFKNKKDGLMSFSEYIQWMGVRKGQSNKEKLKASFRMFDLNADGKLCKEDMRKCLAITSRSVHRFLSEAISENEDLDEFLDTISEEFFYCIDSNKDGYITLKEFLEGHRKHPHRYYALLLF